MLAFSCVSAMAETKMCTSAKYLLDNVWYASLDELVANYAIESKWPQLPVDPCNSRYGGPEKGYFWYYNGSYAVDFNNFTINFSITKQYCTQGIKSSANTISSSEFRYKPERCTSIEGLSVTKALPSLAGPILQTITLTRDGSPAKNYSVPIKMQDRKSQAIQQIVGVTNDSGVFEFLYVPPYYYSTTIDLSVDCFECDAPLRKEIIVIEAESPPLLCLRENY